MPTVLSVFICHPLYRLSFRVENDAEYAIYLVVVFAVGYCYLRTVERVLYLFYVFGCGIKRSVRLDENLDIAEDDVVCLQTFDSLFFEEFVEYCLYP